MRKLISLTMMGVLVMGLGVGISGCSDQASTTSEQTTKGPGGTTKVTEKTSVETSGKNPPAPGHP
jgi:hypothetical protein